MPDFDKIIADLKPLILETGQFIATSAGEFKSSDIEFKGFNDLVSYVDKEAERQLVAGCKKIFPGAGFITEEGTATERTDNYNWIIDPLDGTTNFIHGLPVYSISLALEYQGQVVLGIIYEINRDEMFTARKDGGSFCNGKMILVNTDSQLSGSLIATGFPYYNFEQMSRYLGILNHFMQNTHGLRRLGSAAVDLAYVACGRFDGFFEYNLNAWDVAAGIIIVQEAGGMISDFQGEDKYLFGREIIAGGAVQPEMQKVIASHWNNAS